MVLLTVFCTNSINILAGINGLEAGQSLIIALAVLTHNLLQLSSEPSAELRDAHLFSAYLMLPFAAVTLALLTFNWYAALNCFGDAAAPRSLSSPSTTS
jgi:UDP-N-acetylglucosamine--dolichyl-phosphate N-acetylglucosaminephosphotransferase